MNIQRLFGALVLALALATGAAACGGGGDNGDLVDALVESGAPRDEAECVASNLDGFDADDLRGLVDENASIDDIPEELFSAFIQAGITCNVGG